MPAPEIREVGPAALKLVRKLRRQVLCRMLCPGAKLPSVRMLAETTRVGLVNANRALRRIESEGWAERHRDRGLRVKEDAWSIAHRQLRAEPPAMVFWLQPSHMRTGFETIAHTVTDGFDQTFPGCTIRHLYLEPATVLEAVKQLLQQNAILAESSPHSCEVGYVLVGMPRAVKELFSLCEAPCVVFGFAEPDSRLACVYEDMIAVGRMAGDLLGWSGRIVALCCEDLVGAEVQLIEGIRQSAAAHHVARPGPGDFYCHLPSQPQQYVAQIDRLLSSERCPKGILAVRPEFALATVQVAARKGLKIPDSFQLIGLHHHPMYDFTYPKITSIGAPSLVEIGREVAELLALAMAQRRETMPRRVIPSTLVERESTLPPRR